MKAMNHRGFTLVELLIVIAIFGVVAAMAIPGLLSARRAGNEASAIGSLRAISSSQFVYATTCGVGYFAPALTVLGVAGPSGTAFLSPDLTAADTVVKSQYTITMGSTSGAAASAPASCNGLGAGTATGGFWATAAPAISAGTRSFGTNVRGIVWQATQMAPLAMTDAGTPAGAIPIQ